jgi:chemotaxis protein MotB
MAGHGGGAWKVAYADFVTAMMAFFMVMWITGQSKPIKESIAKYFNDPFGGPTTRPSGTSFQRTYENGDAPFRAGKARFGPGRGRGEGILRRRVKKQDAPAKMSHKPGLFSVHRGERSHVGTLLLFPETSAKLDERAQQRLEELVPLLAGKPNKIEIRGHCTGRPLPAESPYRNLWELCYARCLAVMQFLREHGIEPERIRLSQAGAYEPQAVEGDHQRLADNSRVEVYMLGEHVDDLRGNQRKSQETASSVVSSSPPSMSEQSTAAPARRPQPRAGPVEPHTSSHP